MLEITVPATEVFDEKNELFVEVKECTLHLEHSLLSVSKWESKWHKPFIKRKGDPSHTSEEMLDYIRCMTLNKNVDPMVYSVMTNDNLRDITAYIEDPMTATTVIDVKGAPLRREIVTSELIYYWMITFGIPIECEKWHINRLIMLIRVCSAKTNPSKMSQRAIMAQNRQINEARKKALGTKG